MATPLELLQTLLSTNDDKYLPGLVSFFSETKLLYDDSSKAKDVVNIINDLFTKSKNKKGALLILGIFIKQCPREVLNVNILTWIQHCNRTLLNEDGSISNTSFKLFSELIQLSINFPEIRKEVSLSIIPKSLDYILRELRSPQEGVNAVLQCLEQILCFYGKSCGLHKDEITSIILSFLEHSPLNVSTCARCFLHLAACGSPGANSENYANNWYMQEKFLLNTLHDLMDSLLENIDIHQDSHRTYDLGECKLGIPQVSEKGLLRRKQRLAIQFQSIVEFFSVHLSGAFVASKKILPQSILEVIWRGLSVNCSSLKSANVSADVTTLLTVISDINLSCIKLLNVLIISCRMNLMPYSSLISRILSQILKWTNTEDWPYGVAKPHSLIRVEAYTCASNWLTISRACSGIDKYIDEILSSINSDINFELPILTLKVPPGKGKGKKQKQQSKEVRLTLEYMVDKEGNERTCKAALDLIPVIVSSSSTVMKTTQRELLHGVIVRKLLQIQGSPSCDPPIPYSSTRCRLGLYTALLSLCNNHHPSCPPPINYASLIFSRGMKDSSVEVVAMCVNALSNIGQVLKPPFPSLELPILQTNSSSNRTNFSSAAPKNKRISNEDSTRNSSSKKVKVNGVGDKEFRAFVDKENSRANKNNEMPMDAADTETSPITIDEDDSPFVTVEKTFPTVMDKRSSQKEQVSPVVLDEETSPTDLDKDHQEVSPSRIDKEVSIADAGDKASATVIDDEVSEAFTGIETSLTLDNEAFQTADDSDEEMMNSFVDEVI